MIFCIRAIPGASAWKGKEESVDCATYAVVRAGTEQEARQLAARQAGDEGYGAWFDRSQTRVEIWDPGGPSAFIAGDGAG